MKNFSRFIQSLLLAMSLCGVTPAIAQIEDVQTKNPYVLSGQLFVVRLVPAGHKMQVFVAGNEVSQLQFDKLRMVATVKAGNKIWSVDAGKKDDSFIIKTPPDLPSGVQPELKLKVQYENKSENFDFKMDKKK